jgi:hypothetical protein
MGDEEVDERGLSEAEATERGRAMIAEARAIRRRMLEDAEQRRGALVAELVRVRAEIDAAIRALTDARPAPTTPPPSPPAVETAPVARGTAPAPPGRVGALFDALRGETPPPAPKRRRAEAPPVAGGPVAPPAPQPGPAAADEPAPEPAVDDADPVPPPGPDAASEDPAERLRRRRDALLEPLVPEVARMSKRLLQDEQNSLLDAARRARGRHEPARLLPEPIRQRESWTTLLAPAIDAAYLGGRASAGKTGRVTSAPARLVVELAALLVSPLRERVATTIESVVAEGPYESSNELQRALGSAIGARYREWRTVDLERHVDDVLAAAYARGAYDASPPAAMLEWIPADPGHCPDCDDNALEPTLKGKAFPTGQPHPPAHPGCRCLVVPTDA